MNVFTQFTEKYDVWYKRHKFVYLSELKLLEKVVPSFGKGLEVGVGTGRFALPLKVTLGVDSSHEMLKIANSRGVNTRWALAEDLPFWPESFDWVVIVISLCFMRDPLRALGEVYRVLKKKGKIIIGIVDKDSFLGRFYQTKNSVFYKEAKFFSIKEITEMLKKSGFKKYKYYQTVFNFPEKIKTIQKSLKGYGKGGFIVVSSEK